MAAEDGWPSAINGCNEDGKSMRLDDDKRQDSKEKEAWLPGKRQVQFLVVRVSS